MVNTRNGRAEAEASQANGPNTPPRPTLAQAITSILESRDEQTELLQQLVANSTHGHNGARNTIAPAPTTYSDVAASQRRPLTLCNRVQVLTLVLHGGAEDSLLHEATAW
jgi:hypothetical protein